MVTIIQILLSVFLISGNTIKGLPLSDCCYRKDVGGLQYTLVSEEDTTAHGCDENCLYTRDGMGQSRFCFKTGHLPFHCINTTQVPIDPTTTTIADTTQEPNDPTTTSTTSTIPTTKLPQGPTAPPLEAAQTRIILSWPNQPKDLDLYVRGFNEGNSSCLVYYGEKCGCSSVCQDIDNGSGGSSGPETVTLQNATENANYLYAIGVHDYTGGRVSTDQPAYITPYSVFGSSQAKIEVTNGTFSFSATLPTSNIPDGSWWFFGCISTTADNKINYFPAPAGTLFEGRSQDSWNDMAIVYCNLTAPVLARMEKSENTIFYLPPKE